MDTSVPNRDITVRLANWAGSFLASSMVLLFGIIAVLFMVADFRTSLTERPVGSVLLVTFVAGYVVSFVCLHKIRRRGNNESLRLWAISLVGACTPLLVLAYTFEASSAVLIVGMAEVGAILLHFVAIAIVLRRLAPPNKSLERTREG
jgi:hypothetical protein